MLQEKNIKAKNKKIKKLKNGKSIKAKLLCQQLNN